MKKAFTLVELLVVIGILGVLVAVSVAAMSGGTNAALNVKCETNMRNLATACQNIGMATGKLPLAGSIESMSLDMSNIQNVKKVYTETRGWVSWDSRGKYPAQAHVASPAWMVNTYETDQEVRMYALTNGALWRAVSGSVETYRCPMHVKKFPQKPPIWSYAMNEKFDWAKGNARARTGEPGVGYKGMDRADRTLLFAELPYLVFDDSAADEKNDSVLQSSKNEYIGFNHTSGKRNKFAMVVFADAHTERISMPQGGLSDADLVNLTRWLCSGADIAFDGKRYQEMK